MLRSILVTLDGSPSSMRAGHVALDLGSRHKTHVAALGIINSTWIQRPQPVPIGGIALSAALELSRLNTSTERARALLRHFNDEANARKLSSFDASEIDGDPVALIEKEATSYDLVVVGRDSMFDIEGELYDIPLCIEKVIRREPRPVLMIPEATGEGAANYLDGAVLVAFEWKPGGLSRLAYVRSPRARCGSCRSRFDN